MCILVRFLCRSYRMNSKTRKQLLSFAAATGVLFQLGGTAHAVQVFDLGEFVVKAPVNVAAVETPEVAVTPATVEGAYAGGQVANSNLMGALGRQSFIDTPLNVTGYTSELIENKQASTISDVVANDASVKEHSLSGASSAWTIRGFRTTQQDMQFNGLFGIAPRFYTGTEGYERVEVAKGPTALLNGVAPNGGNIGGSINFVPKRAKDTPINRVKLSYGNGAQFTQHVDVGHRFGDNNKYGVRLNVLNRNGETSVDKERNNVSAVVIGADMRGENHRIGLDLGYVFNEIENPQYRINFGATEENGDSRKLFSGAKFTKENPYTVFTPNQDGKYGANDTYRRVTEKYGVLSGEYDLSKDWTAYAGIGMRSTSLDYYYNEFIVNNLTTGAAKIGYKYNNQINKGVSAEVGVRGKIVDNGVTHNIGVAASRISYERYMGNRTFKTKFDGNVFTQTADSRWSHPDGYRGWESPLNDKNVTLGLSISDRIVTADEAWQVILGGRFQKIKQTTYITDSGFPVDANTTWNGSKKSSVYDKAAFSPAVGIIHKLNKHASIYANYMEGLQKGEIVADGNSTEVLPPFKSKQVEFGAKVDFGNWTSSLSFYNITSPYTKSQKTGAYEAEVRNRGIEWNIFGEPTKGTRILGGVMYLDAKYTSDSRTGAANVEGNRYAGAPKWNAVLGVEQDIKGVKGLTVTSRVKYVGEAYANDANTLRTPGFVTWDLGARYSWKSGNTPMVFRADVYNVLDKTYWNALDRNAVYLSGGRTFMFSLTASL